MRQVTLPSGGLAELRRAIEEAIPADATRALREAGRRLAVDAESALADALNGATLENLSVNDFWVEVSGYFDAAGWGRIEYEALSDGLGAAVAHDWAESDPSEARDAPGCHISTGLLAELLTRVAGEPVAVLEANCRSRGDDACRFIFGSPTNLMALHGHLSRGRTLDEALAEAS
jgi:predicted hydrocarbon binding protein